MKDKQSISTTDSQQQPGTKNCGKCQQPSRILYRIQYDLSRVWIFVCPECWHVYSQDNPNYCYGGTWKQRKK